MKKFVYIILFFTQSVWSQGVFEQANEHYTKGNYQEAIAAYESILKDKKHSCDLYFNLANAYYKKNQIAPAIYYYEKALLLSPNDKDIHNNLKFAEAKRIDDIKVIQKVGFEKLLQNFTSRLHFNTWAYISVVLAALFLVMFLGYYFSEYTQYKRLFFIGMSLLPFLMLLTIGAAWFEKYNDLKERPAIVFESKIVLKNEPRTNATDAFTLHEGTKIYVLEAFGEWRKIQLTDETEGWILNTAIKELKE
jgi:tetratricopeptide (TPR) repeat protein